MMLKLLCLFSYLFHALNAAIPPRPPPRPAQPGNRTDDLVRLLY